MSTTLDSPAEAGNGAAGLYESSLLKRRRRSDAELETLDAQIVDVLEADNPQSVRHVFYRMTNPRLAEPVEKSKLGYVLVQRRCLALRRSGRVHYGWIVDASRAGYHINTFDDAGDFIGRFTSLYRGQVWTRDLPRVEVWCESQSLAGVIRGECKELAVSLYPTRGFPSVTQCWEAAQHINYHSRDLTVILYVGDYDPSGVLIDASLERELRSHVSTPLEFRRLAINEDQITDYDLPTKPRNAGERRRPEIQETVEAEAMPASEMRRIVREAVESYLPEGALDVIKVAEESEKAGLKLFADMLSLHGTDRTVEVMEDLL